jgi:NADH dehydrogenase
VLVDGFLHPKGLPNVFVCGDLAHVEENGKQVPGVAQPAMQMGTYAAQRIKQEIEGRADNKPFHYFDKGDMATIGRSAAVADIKWPFKGHWSGFPAWLTWLTVHIFFLIGFRSRFSVFRQWAWTYLTLNDGARLITGSQALPGWENQGAAHGSETTTPLAQAVAKLDLGSPKTN